MGSFFSKNSDTKTLLGKIENEIENIEDYKSSAVKRQKNYIAILFIISGFIYITAAIIYYFVYFPKCDHWYEKVIYSLPLIVIPFIVWLLKKSLQWYYRWTIDSKDDRLRELKKKKRKILEKVQETETFKDAKEILEKYDPKVLYELSKKNNVETHPQNTNYQINSQLRYRGMSALTSPINANQMRTPLISRDRVPNPALVGPSSMTTPFRPRLALMAPPQMIGPRTPRPIIAPNRGIMEKLVDYVVGDGPSNRYALICNYCHSHNGMALKEEFEYIAFNCCYCQRFNPSRKLKPLAPRLVPQTYGRPSLAPVVDEPESDTDSNKGTAQSEEMSQMNIEDVSEPKQTHDVKSETDISKSAEIPFIDVTDEDSDVKHDKNNEDKDNDILKSHENGDTKEDEHKDENSSLMTEDYEHIHENEISSDGSR